jgi:hypothetical protein
MRGRCNIIRRSTTTGTGYRRENIRRRGTGKERRKRREKKENDK